MVVEDGEDDAVERAAELQTTGSILAVRKFRKETSGFLIFSSLLKITVEFEKPQDTCRFQSDNFGYNPSKEMGFPRM